MSNREIARVLREAADRIDAMDPDTWVHTVTATLDATEVIGVRATIESDHDSATHLDANEPVVLT